MTQSGCSVGIHQPNFFPWLGYFAKILAADRFLYLDDAQLQRTRSSWTNRVKLLIGGEVRWITAPVDRSRAGVHAICDFRFGDTDWRSRTERTITHTYGSAPFFAEVIALLGPLLRNPHDNIADYNIAAVEGLCEALRIGTPRIRASSLSVQLVATERLVELTKRVGGDAYLAGDGADGYQEDELFARAGLGVEYLKFEHPTYPQFKSEHSDFIPGLSIVDPLMNVGIAGTRALLDKS